MKSYNSKSDPTLLLAVAQRKGVSLLTVTSYDMCGHAGYYI